MTVGKLRFDSQSTWFAGIRYADLLFGKSYPTVQRSILNDGPKIRVCGVQSAEIKLY